MVLRWIRYSGVQFLDRVRAQKLNAILLQNVFMFSFRSSVFERSKKIIHQWFAHSNGPDHSKTERIKMAVSLDHFINKIFLYFLIKQSRLTAILFVLISNSRDYKPNKLNHSKSECVRISSPDCTHCNCILFHLQVPS